MNNCPKVAAIILAGGKSTRMGFSKAEACIKGTRLIDVLLSELPHNTVPVVVSPFDLGLTCIQVCEDPPFQGPVAGLVAGLAAVTTVDFISVLAVDAPHSPRLIPAQLAALAATPDADICTVDSGFIHPIGGLWRAGALFRQVASLKTNFDVPLKQLLDDAVVITILGTGDEKDYDTPAELSQFIRRLEAQDMDTHCKCDQRQNNGNNGFVHKINR